MSLILLPAVDVAAGQAAGCQALFIDCGYSEKRPEKPYLAVKSLSEAAGLMLRLCQ